MRVREAKHWARETAASFVEQSWDQCDWDEKTGPNAEKLDQAMRQIVAKLRPRAKEQQ